MSWVAAGMVGSAVVTSYGANKAAKTANQGVQAQIEAQREALAAGQDASKFRAVGFRSPYLSNTQFTTDDQGYLTNVDYTLTPEMQQRATTFGNLGTGVLQNISTDPMAVASQRTNQTLSLLDPGRQMQTERMMSSLANKGLTGIGADIGYGNYVNPMMAGLQSTFAQQDLNIANQSLNFAQQDILNRINLAGGLFSKESGVYDVGRSEFEYARQLADTERQRRLEGAGMTAQAATNIADYTSQIANNNSQMQAALYGQAGNIVGKLPGLLAPQQQQQQPQDTGFRFYNAPAPQQRGYEDAMLTQRYT